MIYQHETTRGANKSITHAMDTQVQREQAQRSADDAGPAGVLVPAG